MGSTRNKFDPRADDERLNFLAGPNLELFPYILGDDDLVLWRYRYDGHMSPL